MPQIFLSRYTFGYGNIESTGKVIKFEEFIKMLFTKNFLHFIKEEMYNTMNLYYKYTSILKSSFYKINILILPISTREKYLKCSIYFASICDYQPL